MGNVNWFKSGFFIAAFFAASWVLCAWLNPISNNHYNPSKTQHSHQRPATGFMPPPNIDAKGRQTKETTDKEIEEWQATRSDLAAQWKAADMSQLAFRISILGVILLFWTIYETLNAGRELRRQNEIALKTAKAEFQPYLVFSERIELNQLELSYFDGCDDIAGATAVTSDHHIQIAPRISVTNRGKSPATDFFVTHYGKITNNIIPKPKAKDRQIIREVFEFYGDRVGPHYLGLDEEKPIDLSLSIVFDQEAEAAFIKEHLAGTYVNSIRDMSFMNARFLFNITLSFSDQFSENRRAFQVSYFGKITKDWVTLGSSCELLPHEEEYVEHQKKFDAFIKQATHHASPEA